MQLSDSLRSECEDFNADISIEEDLDRHFSDALHVDFDFISVARHTS